MFGCQILAPRGLYLERLCIWESITFGGGVRCVAHKYVFVGNVYDVGKFTQSWSWGLIWPAMITFIKIVVTANVGRYFAVLVGVFLHSILQDFSHSLPPFRCCLLSISCTTNVQMLF